MCYRDNSPIKTSGLDFTPAALSFNPSTDYLNKGLSAYNFQILSSLSNTTLYQETAPSLSSHLTLSHRTVIFNRYTQRSHRLPNPSTNSISLPDLYIYTIELESQHIIK